MSRPCLSCEFYNDDYYSGFAMLGNQRLLGNAHKRLQPVEGKRLISHTGLQ